MNRTLIPHPRFSLATPVITAREMALAAICAGLKSQLNQRYMQLRAQAEQIGNLAGLVVMMGEHAAAQAAKITALEERNRQLTKALHRQATAGFVAMDYLVSAAPLLMIAAAVPVIGWRGALYVVGSLGIGAGLMLYFARRICEAWDDHRTPVAPSGAHLPEPSTDARIDYPAIGEAYADESEFEPFERVIHHPEAQAARARFEATAAALR
jgi:hypothetical protein